MQSNEITNTRLDEMIAEQNRWLDASLCEVCRNDDAMVTSHGRALCGNCYERYPNQPYQEDCDCVGGHDSDCPLR